jgi:hypothetical protein
MNDVESGYSAKPSRTLEEEIVVTKSPLENERENTQPDPELAVPPVQFQIRINNSMISSLLELLTAV